MSSYPSFPSLVPIMIGTTRTARCSTISHEFENGIRQTRAKWGRSRKEYKVPLSALTELQRTTLWDFFVARKGGADGFLLSDPWIAPIVGEAVGTGNGTTTIFALANKYIQASTVWVYLNGARQTSGYSLQDDAGTVTFSTAPGAGVAITADYRYSVLVRFKADELPVEEVVPNMVYKTEIELEEVLL